MKSFSRSVALFLIYVSLFSGGARGQGTYEILHDTLSATGWFGGDNTGGGPRNAGIGQGVRIDTTIVLTDFSFYFATRFDYAMNPDGFGHDVTLVLNIRDSLGTILQTLATFVPASFESGWVTWTDINLGVAEGTFLIFTTYLVGGYDLNQYTSSNGSDQFQLYTPGPRYGKDGVSDADMELWTDWGQHPSWDSMFWLVGTIQTVAVKADPPSPQEYALLQNYPNPFNPTTVVEFRIPEAGQATLKILNVLGEEVETLVNESFQRGIYRRTWDARDQPTGMYFARLKAPNTLLTRKMLFVR